MSISARIAYYYKFLFSDLADSRTNHWPLIGSPFPALFLLICYLYFVNSWGPRYMKDRKPFNLQKILIVYNFIQVVVSILVFYEGLAGGWMANYNWRCQPVDFSRSPQAMRMAQVCYMYFIAKLTELLDTVFFVVRKKEKQITFLHLYHHTVMPMISWGATKYYPGGHGTFIGIVNSFVHIIMYTYYFFAAMGPQYQKYLWWKKYITNMQMIQFCIAFLHSAQLLYTDCGYPRWSVCFTMPNTIFFYLLFNDFYQKSYKKKKAKLEEIQKLINETNDFLPHELKLLEQAKLRENGIHGGIKAKVHEVNGNSMVYSNGNYSNGGSNGYAREISRS